MQKRTAVLGGGGSQGEEVALLVGLGRLRRLGKDDGIGGPPGVDGLQQLPAGDAPHHVLPHLLQAEHPHEFDTSCGKTENPTDPHLIGQVEQLVAQTVCQLLGCSEGALVKNEKEVIEAETAFILLI